MTREDIIRMAREAEDYADTIYENPGKSRVEIWLEVRDQRFAALVAEAEREACEQICERRKSLYWMEFDKTGSDADRAAAIASEECADAIRARGSK